MKKLLLDLINKYFNIIAANWAEKVLKSFRNKFTKEQIEHSVKENLNLFKEILSGTEDSLIDKHLILIYEELSRLDLTLLEVSNVFSIGRNEIINRLESEEKRNTDSLFLIGFIDELFEEVFARFSMMHQEKKTYELSKNIDRLTQKLEQNQQYLQNILQTADSAIMVIDKDESIVAWNEGAQNIFGYTKEDVLNKPSSFLIPNKDKYKKELDFIISEVNKSGKVQILETERTTKSGDLIPVQLNVTRLQNAKGNYYGRTVVIKDVTEVKRLQQQVDQSEKLAVIGQLAAGVAHEIGNPLTSISSLVQILQRKNEDKFSANLLKNIKENIDRISKIVRELVDLSRPPSNIEELTQVTDIIKTALGIVKYDKRVKEVQFVTKFDEKSPFVKIVPDQLLQVFINIFINSLDAIEGRGKIKVISSHDEKHIYIEFIDNGCGIDESILKKIFDPFFTTKEAGKGTGLGLAISYNIIKKLNGDIVVSSTVGKGSKFSVILPINK